MRKEVNEIFCPGKLIEVASSPTTAFEEG